MSCKLGSHTCLPGHCQKGFATPGERRETHFIVLKRGGRDVIFPDDAGMVLLNVWSELNKCHLEFTIQFVLKNKIK